MPASPPVVCVIGARARGALGERLALVQAALDVADVIEVAGPGDVTRLRSKSMHYLLDANQATCMTGAWLAGRRVPFVVDTGDDPARLARNNGLRSAAIRGWAANRLLAGAAGVVHRGFFHGPVLRSVTDAPLLFAPDTVPDELLDRPPVGATDPVVASFGSASAPMNGDRAYGWEVVDAVAAVPGVQGVLVVRGPGIDTLRARARRLGVHGRIAVHGPVDLDSLVDLLQSASIVTSIQSDDLAGWVRTTGKLPLALGMGKMVASSAVGEATRTLPKPFLLPADDAGVASQVGTLALECVGVEAASRAKVLAERFRRSTVTGTLRRFIEDLPA